MFLGTIGPSQQRHRTAAAWLPSISDELFKKTALLINAEHTAAAAAELARRNDSRRRTREAGCLWYGGGNERPKLAGGGIQGVPAIRRADLRGAGAGHAGRRRRAGCGSIVPAVQASNYNMFFHSDSETPATVPPPGLAATTRAYAKIIEEANKLDLSDLQRPAPAPSTAGR